MRSFRPDTITISFLSKARVEATGGGSFATTLGMGTQKAIRLSGEHVFRYRVNATYCLYWPVSVHGFNAYGQDSARMAGEPRAIATLTGRRRVFPYATSSRRVGYQFQTVNATHFSGTTGVGVNGEPTTVGKGYSNLFTVASAVEYNFNPHVGLIAGPWFSLTGRNTSDFFGFGGLSTCICKSPSSKSPTPLSTETLTFCVP